VEIDARRERIATYAKWGLALAGAAIVAPVAFLAVKGIIGLAIAAALGTVVIAFAQPFANTVANWRMKAIKAEAERNPIETMQNLYLAKAKELERSDAAIQDFVAEILNFSDQLGAFKSQYPEEAAKYDELLSKMQDALSIMKSEQKIARIELDKFYKSIQKAEAIYRMATAAAKVTKLSGKAESQVFAQIRQQVAVDSVRGQLNRAFASLDTALERRTTIQQALPPGREVEVIEVKPAPEPIKVRRP
jgi:hypothetical protein